MTARSAAQADAAAAALDVFMAARGSAGKINPPAGPGQASFWSGAPDPAGDTAAAHAMEAAVPHPGHEPGAGAPAAHAPGPHHGASPARPGTRAAGSWSHPFTAAALIIANSPLT